MPKKKNHRLKREKVYELGHHHDANQASKKEGKKLHKIIIKA